MGGWLADLFDIQIRDATFRSGNIVGLAPRRQARRLGAARIKTGPVAFLDLSPLYNHGISGFDLQKDLLFGGKGYYYRVPTERRLAMDKTEPHSL